MKHGSERAMYLLEIEGLQRRVRISSACRCHSDVEFVTFPLVKICVDESTYSVASRHSVNLDDTEFHSINRPDCDGPRAGILSHAPTFTFSVCAARFTYRESCRLKVRPLPILGGIGYACDRAFGVSGGTGTNPGKAFTRFIWYPTVRLILVFFALYKRVRKVKTKFVVRADIRALRGLRTMSLRHEYASRTEQQRSWNGPSRRNHHIASGAVDYQRARDVHYWRNIAISPGNARPLAR